MRSARVAGISDEELLVFGLSPAEVKIFLGLIELGPIRVSRLSREVGLSHTTIHSAIRRLSAQGLVQRVPARYASIWKSASFQKIQKQLNKALKPLHADVIHETQAPALPKNSSPSKDVLTFSGRNAILSLYQWFFLNNRSQKVYFMRSNAIDQSLKKVSRETTDKLQELIVFNRISPEIVYMASEENAQKAKESGREGLKNDYIEQESTRWHFVTGETLDTPSELVLGRNSALLTSWGEGRGDLIKDPTLFAYLCAMLRFAREAGGTEHSPLEIERGLET